MKIQVNTDHNIEGSEGLDQQTEAVVESTLGHLAEQLPAWKFISAMRTMPAAKVKAARCAAFWRLL
ncbi:MAG: hypothetical protein WA269_04280 [Candidatus Udaeobacter sp.]